MRFTGSHRLSARRGRGAGDEERERGEGGRGARVGGRPQHGSARELAVGEGTSVVSADEFMYGCQPGVWDRGELFRRCVNAPLQRTRERRPLRAPRVPLLPPLRSALGLGVFVFEWRDGLSHRTAPDPRAVRMVFVVAEDDGELRNKPAHAVPLASGARQHPEEKKVKLGRPGGVPWPNGLVVHSAHPGHRRRSGDGPWRGPHNDGCGCRGQRRRCDKRNLPRAHGRRSFLVVVVMAASRRSR